MPFWQHPGGLEHHTNLSLPFRTSPVRLTVRKLQLPSQAVVLNRSAALWRKSSMRSPRKSTISLFCAVESAGGALFPSCRSISVTSHSYSRGIG